MAKQGKTTKEYAKELSSSGWSVLFKCIPNTPHFKVVPIPTSHGISKQRYPDIAAVKTNTLLLIEVEITLTEHVTRDIILRFKEMREALENDIVYSKWANKISRESGVRMPVVPTLETRLIIVNLTLAMDHAFIVELKSYGIIVISATHAINGGNI